MRRVYIIQDQESGLFLYPHYGSVNYTQWFGDAGRFDDEESAIETAHIFCTEGFQLHTFFEES